jgi:hypothetical protein
MIWWVYLFRAPIFQLSAVFSATGCVGDDFLLALGAFCLYNKVKKREKAFWAKLHQYTILPLNRSFVKDKVEIVNRIS